jgi:hypothetical protein
LRAGDINMKEFMTASRNAIHLPAHPAGQWRDTRAAPRPESNLSRLPSDLFGSVRAECLARMVPLGEAHFRAAVRSFVDHYHEERPHLGSKQ